jgi:hypothetical protein
VGIATLTTVTSSSAMNCPASSTISMSQRPRAAVAGSRRRGSVMVVTTAACARTGDHAESLLILVSPLPGYLEILYFYAERTVVRLPVTRGWRPADST